MAITCETTLIVGQKINCPACLQALNTNELKIFSEKTK